MRDTYPGEISRDRFSLVEGDLPAAALCRMISLNGKYAAITIIFGERLKTAEKASPTVFCVNQFKVSVLLTAVNNKQRW